MLGDQVPDWCADTSKTIVFGGDELDVGPGATRRGGAHRN